MHRYALRNGRRCKNVMFIRVLEYNQRTENPRVGGSIPSLATIYFKNLQRCGFFVFRESAISPHQMDAER